MRLRWLLIPFWSTLLFGQVSGRLYLEKETFAPGEPVFLYSEVTNTGTEALEINHADPYTFCSGYQLHVSSDADPSSSCGGRGFAGSCLSSYLKLKPGEKFTERIVLNYDHKVNAPGDYDVQAERSIAYANSDTFPDVPHSQTVLREHFHFRVDANATMDSRVLDKLVAQLHSKDYEKRRGAARVLSSVAPKPYEDELLALAADPELKMFAPMAFYRLNTPRSMAAMAELMRKSQFGTYEHMESARYLAQSGDPQWFSLLLEAALKKPQIGDYLSDAAQSDGETMLPYLMVFLHSPDMEFTRVNAISAMGDTGVRDAVPVLIELIKDPDESSAERALWGLRQLTHMSAGEAPWGSARTKYSKWLAWWAREGSTARIYKANECGEIGALR